MSSVLTRLVPALLALPVFAGCVAAPSINTGGPPPPPPAAEARYTIVTASPGVPRELQWSRNSAESKAIYAQTYALALEHIRARAATLAGRDWAVVSDADETLLDNSEYQVRLTMMGQPHSEELWSVWVADRRAVLHPGAAAFVEGVHAAGGRVVVVTNRSEPLCADTAANFETLGLQVDGILCASEGWDKEARFAAVAAGTTGLGLPPLEVVMFLGDQIKDCPGQTQQRFDPARFGERCFLFPNPMYGSWERNPFR